MLDFIKKHEGCKLKAYKDTEGVWTIGFGNIYINGRRVISSDRITQSQADLMLKEHCEKYVYPILGHFLWLNDNQKRALASLIYNCGDLKRKCPSLWKALETKDYKQIYKQWDYGLKNGLFTRRSEELALFFKYPYKV